MNLQDHLSEMMGSGPAEASFATVDENGVSIEEDGVYLKVTLHPSGSPRTVRLGATYVGPEFGLWTLPKDDDELLVVTPRDGGIGVAVTRLPNAIDKVPVEDLEALADKNPVLFIHASGWKLKASDDEVRLIAGDVPVIIEGTAIKAGDDSAIALANENFKTWATAEISRLNTQMGLILAHTHGRVPPDPTFIGALGGFQAPGSNTVTTKVKGT